MCDGLNSKVQSALSEGFPHLSSARILRSNFSPIIPKVGINAFHLATGPLVIEILGLFNGINTFVEKTSA